jgi:hypothetical protein
MLATTPATRIFLQKAVQQGAKTTVRALSTQSSIWTPSTINSAFPSVSALHRDTIICCICRRRRRRRRRCVCVCVCVCVCLIKNMMSY